MKNLFLLVIPVFLFNSIAYADNGIVDEKIYVVQQQNGRPATGSECDWAYAQGVNVVLGTISDLYSVQSKKTTGSLLVNDIKKVGEIIGCVDTGEPTYERPINPPGVGYPTYELGHVWKLLLDGKSYVVTGMSRVRAEDFGGALGTILAVATGTIFTEDSFLEVPPIPVGSLSGNYIVNVYGLPYPAEVTGSIFTFRIYSNIY